MSKRYSRIVVDVFRLVIVEFALGADLQRRERAVIEHTDGQFDSVDVLFEERIAVLGDNRLQGVGQRRLLAHDVGVHAAPERIGFTTAGTCQCAAAALMRFFSTTSNRGVGMPRL